MSNKVEESNTWVKFAGIFKDDPFFDEFVEDMATYRRELDVQFAVEEMNSVATGLNMVEANYHTNGQETKSNHEIRQNY